MAADLPELLTEDSDREEGEMTPETLSPKGGEYMEFDDRGDVNHHIGMASGQDMEQPLANMHNSDNDFGAEVRRPSPPVAIVHRNQLLNAMNAPLPPLAAGQQLPAAAEAATGYFPTMQQPSQVPAQLPSLSPLPPQQVLTQQQIAHAAKKVRQRAHKRAKLVQADAADSATPASGMATPAEGQNYTNGSVPEATKRLAADFLAQQQHILSVAPPSGPAVRHESLVISFDDDDFHSPDKLPAQAGLVPTPKGKRILTDLEMKMAQLRAQIARQERPQGLEKASPANSAPSSPPLMAAAPPLVAAAPPTRPSAFFAPRPPAVRAPAKPQVVETGTAANRPLASTSTAVPKGKAPNSSQPKAPSMRTENGATAQPPSGSQTIAQRIAPAPLQQQKVVPVLGLQENGSAEQPRTPPELAQLPGPEQPGGSQLALQTRLQPTDNLVLPRPSSSGPPPGNHPPGATTSPPISHFAQPSRSVAVQPNSQQKATQMASQHNPSAEHQPVVNAVPASSPNGEALLPQPVPPPSPVLEQIPKTQVALDLQEPLQPNRRNATPEQHAAPSSKPPSAGKRRSVKRSAASSAPAGIAKLAADMGPMKRLRQLSGNPKTPTLNGQPQQPHAAHNGFPERPAPEQAVAVHSEPQQPHAARNRSPERAALEQAVAVQSEPQSPNAIQAALVDAEEMERNMQGSLYSQQAAVRRLEVRKARLLAELSTMDAALDIEKQKAAEYQQKLQEASAAVLAKHSQLLRSVQQAVPMLHALEAPPSGVQASSSRQQTTANLERSQGALVPYQSHAHAREAISLPAITISHPGIASPPAEGRAAATVSAGAAQAASIGVVHTAQSHTTVVDVTASTMPNAQHIEVQQADAPAKESSQRPAAVEQPSALPKQTATLPHERHHSSSRKRATAEVSLEQTAVEGGSPTSSIPQTMASMQTQPPSAPVAHKAVSEATVVPVASHKVQPSLRASASAGPPVTASTIKPSAMSPQEQLQALRSEAVKKLQAKRPLQQPSSISPHEGRRTSSPQPVMAEAMKIVTPVQDENPPTTSSQRTMASKQAQQPPTTPVARTAVSEASVMSVASPRTDSSLRVSLGASPRTAANPTQPAASSPQEQLQALRSEAENKLRAMETTLQKQRQQALSLEKARSLASSKRRKEEPSQGVAHTCPETQPASLPRISDTGICVGTEADTQLQNTPATASSPIADTRAEPAHASAQSNSFATQGEAQLPSTPVTVDIPCTDAEAEAARAFVQSESVKQEQFSSPLADAIGGEDGAMRASADSVLGATQLLERSTQQHEAQATAAAVAEVEDADATGLEEAVMPASKSPERSRDHGASVPVPARVALPENGLRNQPSFSTWLKPQGAPTIVPSSGPALVFANSRAFPFIRISTPEPGKAVHTNANESQESKPYSSPLAWFRSSRLLRQYEHAWHRSLQSATFTHNINTSKPLCPFDLRGKCNDKDCVNQHQAQYLCTEKQALQDLNSLLEAAREHAKGKQVSSASAHPARSLQELQRLLETEKSLNMIVFGRRVGFRSKLLDAEVGDDIALVAEEVPQYYLLNQTETAFSTLSDYWFDFGDTAAACSLVLPAVRSTPHPQARADMSARLSSKRYYTADSPALSPTDTQHAEKNGNEDEVAALEKYIQENPTDCEARVALAVKCYLRYDPIRASKQEQEEALKVLAKALDKAPQNVAIWWVYLHLFCKRQDATEAAEMLGYGVQYCRFSYELWCFVIGNAESISALQDISYRAMVWLSASVLLSTEHWHSSSSHHDCSSGALTAGLDSWHHKSACLLDVALRLLAALSMAGQSELALVWVNELVTLAETQPDLRPAAYKPSPQVEDTNLAAVPAEPHAFIGLLTALHPRDLCVLWLAAAHTVMHGALPNQVAERLGYKQDLLVIDWPTVETTGDWDTALAALVERLFAAASRDWQGCMGVYSEAGGSSSTHNDVLEARECFAANAVLWTRAMRDAQVAIKTSSVLVARYPTSCQLLRLHLTLLSEVSGLKEVAAFVHNALVVSAMKGEQSAGFHKTISKFLALCSQDRSSAAAAVDALLETLQQVSRSQGVTTSQQNAAAFSSHSVERLLQVYEGVSSHVRMAGDDEAYRHINLACLQLLGNNADMALAAMHVAIKVANSSSARQRVAKEYLALQQLLSSSPTSVVSILCDLIQPDVYMLPPLASPLQGFADQRLQDVCTPPALMVCNGWTEVLHQLLEASPIFVQNSSIWVEAIEAALLLMPSQVSIALQACKKVFAPAANGMRQEHLPACVWALRLAFESLLHAKQSAGDAAWEEVARYCLAIEATDTSLDICKQGLKLYPFSTKLRQQLLLGDQTALAEGRAGASAAAIETQGVVR